MPDRLTKISLRNPRKVFALLGLVTVILASGLPRVRTEFGYRPLLGGGHPSIQTLERFIESFEVGGLPLQVVWECGYGYPCESALDRDSLTMAYTVTRTLEPLPGVRSIQSPATTPLLVPDPYGFGVRQFVSEGRLAPDREALAVRALQDPLWVGNLVSDDGKVGVIVVQPVDSRSETSIDVVEAVQEALAPFEAKGFEFHLVGHAVEFAVAGPQLAKSTARLVPATALIIAGVLFGLSRSWWVVGLSLGTLGLALIWTFGLLGWLGWPQDHILDVLAPLILVVGVCDAIHYFTRYAAGLRSRAEPLDRQSRIDIALHAAREVGPPCLLTTLTTVAAFLSFIASDLETFVRFGVIASFGTLSCLLLTFTLLPILLTRCPPRAVQRTPVSATWDLLLVSIIDTTSRRALPVLVSTGVLFVVCGIGWWAYLRVDTDRYEMFGDQSSVMRSVRFVEDRLGRSDNLEIEIHLPPDQIIDRPEVLQTVSEFSAFLSSVRGLGRTRSCADVIGWLNRLVHDDDPAFQRPSDRLETNAELLELATLQYPDLLNGWMSFDRSRLRISVDAELQSVAERKRILEEVGQYVRSMLPADWEISLTGPFAIEFDWVRDVQRTQLHSFSSAFFLILILVAAALRSIRLAVAAMVPTLVPVVIILGAMGWMGMSLDVGRSMIAAVLLGISVDDSIHLLTRYRRERISGKAPGDAIRASVLHVGRAVITTSVALSIGFLTLLASAWQTVSSFGFLVSIGIMGALAADLFLLPSLIFARAGREWLDGVEAPAIQRARRIVKRPVFAAISAAPVCAMLALAWILAARPDTTRELGCWVLPNGRIGFAPELDGSCPLHANERISSIQLSDGGRIPLRDLSTLDSALEGAGHVIELAVLRQGEERWFEVPVESFSIQERIARVGSVTLITGLLLCIPLILLWRSSSAAAVPFAFFYSAAAIVIVATVCGKNSATLSYGALAAMAAGPGILVHLSLTFPTERRIARAGPWVIALPYLACTFLLPVLWVALERNTALWPATVTLILVLSAGAWLILIASCGFAVRDSSSTLERARARVLWYGALLLPLLPTLFLSTYGRGAPQTIATYLAVSAIVMPLPIGLAISRYNLFNLGLDLRSWIARMVYLAAAACCLAALLWAASSWLPRSNRAPDPVVLFSVSFGSLAILEPLRKRIVALLEGVLSRRGNRLRKLLERYARQMTELQTEEEVARLLATAVRDALCARAGSVFLRSGSEWRLADAVGEAPPVSLSLVEFALLLEGTTVRYLSADLDTESKAASSLRAGGVELIGLLKQGGEPIGILLLREAESARPYTRLELDFVGTAIHQATTALNNARLADDLLAAERRATTGRIALALAHDVGKNLDWLSRLVARLPQRLADPHRATRDLGTIQDLTEELARSIRGFIREAQSPNAHAPETTDLDILIERAVASLSRVHGAGRFVRSVTPGARGCRVHRNLERVLVNLMDNAILAGAGEDSVHVFATLENGHVRITITDRGGGMEGWVAARAFEPGFTTRAGRGGSGIGLTVSREIIESLGGRIDLCSDSGAGTVAEVILPLEEGRGR